MRNAITLAACGVAAFSLFVSQGCASMCGPNAEKRTRAPNNAEAVADQNNTSSGLTAGETSNNGMLF